MNTIKIIHGDCLDIMPGFGQDHVDALVSQCDWDSVISLEPMWNQLKRIIKPRGAIVMTASQPFTTDLINSNRKMFKYEWIWDKKQSGSFPLAKYHPTQKPVSLMAYMIKTYTNENDTVLDFCMGSGTTGVACIKTKRNFIGIEKDEKYFNIAKERLKRTIIKQGFFADQYKLECIE